MDKSSVFAAGLKRAIDLVGATVGLVLLSVPMMLVALLVRIKLGRPILFRHQRPGLAGQPFVLLKFRTMSDARGPDGSLLSDVDRVTPFGRWLRATSIDELPELFNVLKGEMSLVGPRPLLMEYLGRYDPEQNRRHDVKPGITGWAQINGRSRIGWDEKFRLDVWYVDNHSSWLDLKILMMTLVGVLRREGIIAEGTGTYPPFMFSDEPLDEGRRAE